MQSLFIVCDIGYIPLKTRLSLQEVEGSHLCCIKLGQVCQILPSVSRQGAVKGL